jgi:hypothetical protein
MVNVFNKPAEEWVKQIGVLDVKIIQT